MLLRSATFFVILLYLSPYSTGSKAPICAPGACPKAAGVGHRAGGRGEENEVREGAWAAGETGIKQKLLWNSQ